MSAQASFLISLIVYDTSSIVSELIKTYRTFLETPEPAFDTHDIIDIHIIYASSEDEVMHAVSGLTNKSPHQRIIVLSNQLCLESSSGYLQSDLCRNIRTHMLQTPQHLCGLLALVTGESSRTVDIDKVFSLQVLTLSQLKKSIIGVAQGLWLKSPRPATFNTANTPKVCFGIAQNIHELRECLTLRHRMYDALGYLEEPISSCRSHIETDMFDTQALHFVALECESHRVIGTVRLVMVAPNGLSDSVVGNPTHVIREQGEWIERLEHEALQTGDTIFANRRQSGMGLPFPILRNTDFGEKWKVFLDDYSPETGGEISRLVVSPLYRGLGISEKLMRVVIATAVDIHKTSLLLECVPIHVPMYEKYGFTRIEGHRCRAREIDQVAVGMAMDLTDHPFNHVVASARSDKFLLTHSLSTCAG